jgi:hypothetical protein
MRTQGLTACFAALRCWIVTTKAALMYAPQPHSAEVGPGSHPTICRDIHPA